MLRRAPPPNLRAARPTRCSRSTGALPTSTCWARAAQTGGSWRAAACALPQRLRAAGSAVPTPETLTPLCAGVGLLAHRRRAGGRGQRGWPAGVDVHPWRSHVQDQRLFVELQRRLGGGLCGGGQHSAGAPPPRRLCDAPAVAADGGACTQIWQMAENIYSDEAADDGAP